MLQEMLNLVRLEVYRVMKTYSKNRVGTVTSYDPKTHMVKVAFQPRGNESGWIPVSAHHMGDGFGVMIGPAVGDQLEIGFQEGDPDTPRVIGRYHSDKDKPPQIKSGEILLKHKSGSTIMFKEDGTVHIKSHGGLFINGSGETA